MVKAERLQKALSQLGLGSRREMETWIETGLVQVNGITAKLGDRVTAGDQLRVRGKIVENPLAQSVNTRILLYHKPVGEISSRSDPKHPQTVFDALPPLKQGRWIQVGRLDLNTSGLLIFTNNGELANQLMHPKYQFEREYSVRVHGSVTPDMLRTLQQGVKLEDGLARFEKLTFQGGEGSNAWYNVVLTEGRNRMVRRLWASQGVEVSRLIRIRFGLLYLPRSLSRGKWIELSLQDVKRFLDKLK